MWLFFPLVVTSGDLFPIASSARDPAPVAVEHVSFQRELKSGKLSGSFSVTFVRQDALETFMAEFIDPMAALSAELVDKRLDFLKTTDLAWVD